MNKKLLLVGLIITLVFGLGCVDNKSPKSDIYGEKKITPSDADVIIEGQGWKSVILGATRDSIDQELGKPKKISDFKDVYFGEYYSQGIEINYDKSTDRARAIFFYHSDIDNPEFNNFNKETDRNIGFKSMAEDVINIYGEPFKDFEEDNWRRIEYGDIDFRFVNGKMVRISVFYNN